LTNRTKVQIIINKLSFGEISFAVRNIIRNFANNKRKEKRKMIQKKYSEEQERMARFAKAMGHPARMAILQFLARQESCFFGDIHEVLLRIMRSIGPDYAFVAWQLCGRSGWIMPSLRGNYAVDQAASCGRCITE